MTANVIEFLLSENITIPLNNRLIPDMGAMKSNYRGVDGYHPSQASSSNSMS